MVIIILMISQYLQWSELRLNQNIFNGILDSVKSRIAKNILLNGYFYFKFNKSDLIISNDSSTFNIVIDIDEGNPVIINKIYFEDQIQL